MDPHHIVAEQMIQAAVVIPLNSLHLKWLPIFDGMISDSNRPVPLSKPPPTCHLRSTPAPLLFYLLPNLSLYDSPKASSSSSKPRIKHKHTLFVPNNFHTQL